MDVYNYDVMLGYIIDQPTLHFPKILLMFTLALKLLRSGTFTCHVPAGKVRISVAIHIRSVHRYVQQRN